MRRLISELLICAMLLTGAAFAEADTAVTETSPTQAITANESTLTIGGGTPMSGNFFGEMFGSNTADIEAQTLLHGYNLMHWDETTGSYNINNTVVSGLVATDDEAGNRVYTMTLYPDLCYSDGTAITARDYAFAMLLSLCPQMREIGAETTYSDYVVGSDEYMRGDTDVLSGMRLINDTMFSIKIKAEYEPFFYELAVLDYSPLPIAEIAPGCEVVDEGAGVCIRNIDRAIEEEIFTAELLRDTILDLHTGYIVSPVAVSGAYTLERWDAQTGEAVFVRNPHFKGDPGGRVPAIERVVYKPMDPEELIPALEAGEIDLANKCTLATTIDAGNALVAQGGYTSSSYDRSGYSFMGFACEKPTVSSVYVRQALAHLIDRETIVDSYVGDYGQVVDGYYGIGQWMYALASGEADPPASDTAQGEWESVNLDGIPKYDFDVDAAIALLEADGWTLDRNGEAYDPGMDDARCKLVDGELVALDLMLYYPEGNAIGGMLDECFVQPCALAGVVLHTEPKTMTELLANYYRSQEYQPFEREADIMYLATNFATVFDPSYTFDPDDAYQGAANRSGIRDEELYRRAVELRLTAPGDALAYCRKWVAFQERWAEVLPAIPLYSNTYYDFCRDTLHGYDVGSEMTWADAVLGAYIG